MRVGNSLGVTVRTPFLSHLLKTLYDCARQPQTPLRRANSRLASKSNTFISKISPETLLHCRHIPQNTETKMPVVSPFSETDQSPEPKFQHRLHSPNVRTLSLIHQSSSHPSETYLLGSSGRTQRASSLSPSLMQPLTSFFRRITHCRGTYCDHVKSWQNLPQAPPQPSRPPLHACPSETPPRLTRRHKLQHPGFCL